MPPYLVLRETVPEGALENRTMQPGPYLIENRSAESKSGTGAIAGNGTRRLAADYCDSLRAGSARWDPRGLARRACGLSSGVSGEPCTLQGDGGGVGM